MKRSQNSELTHRINQAFMLIEKGLPKSQITKEIIEMFGVSKTQAYRYIQEAQKHKQLLAIPEEKSVFTVKLSLNIIQRVKTFAKSRSISISEVVKRALEDFLKKMGHG